MQFATALVEYLVTGIAALLWAAPLINHLWGGPWPRVEGLPDEVMALLCLPLAYVIGLYIDVSSSFALRRGSQILGRARRSRALGRGTRWVIWGWRRVIRFFAGSPNEGSYSRSAEILAAAPETLSQAMQAYVSRDRIARGMMLNTLIAGVVATFLLDGLQRPRMVGVACVAFLWSLMVWSRLERLSTTFKKQALKQLRAVRPQT